MTYPLLLHAKHRGTDVTYAPFGPWTVPWRFDTLEEEYEALRTRVGLIDFSTQAVIEVAGKDRISFLHSLLTNDITRLAPGSGCSAALLDPNARLIAELLVIAEAEVIWLLCEATRAEVVTRTLERYVFSEQVTVINLERRDAVLAFQGPRTLAALSRLIGEGGTLRHPGDHVTRTVHDVPLRLIRHRLAGEEGVLCLVPAALAHHAWELFAHDDTHVGLRLVGWEALNTVRIEAGIPWYGIDMNESNLLPETGLEAEVVSHTKGCYVGQEIVARMQTYGSANKKLVGLVFEGEEVPTLGDLLMDGEKEVGHITSACYSPRLQRAVGMGYVKRGFYEPGTHLELLRWAMRVPVVVVPRPPLANPAQHP